MNEQQIQEQAKKIMDEFVAALDEIPEVSELGQERGDGVREPAADPQSDEFAKRMLKNAPRTKGTSILAEKKSW